MSMSRISLASSTTIYDRIVKRIQKQLVHRVKIPFEIRLWGDRAYQFGEGEPAVEIVVQDPKDLAALSRLDELGICEAYMDGSLDVVGDMLGFVSLRGNLSDNHPLDYLWTRIAPLILGRSTANLKAIASHYEFDNDFYFKFLDETRSYSQALYEDDGESLETAQRRKLAYVVDACGLQAGDRVLDVGCGWGSFVEHAGLQGIKVTALTISKQSEKYTSELIGRLNLPAKVLMQDFLEYATAKTFDAIVILGVMEHLPNYQAVLQQIRHLLKPGGRLYLDASAFRDKYEKPAFVSRHIFPGDHSYFCLHEFLAEVARSPLEIVAVYNDRHSYYLTCKAWAEQLDNAQSEVIDRWGETLYRRFRLYLWGSSYAFLNRGMEAYRVVLERPLEN